uniref:Uncharacterized protein n=1 Tax=Junco hyemalis TaxID=40217 RepID=A0A8C5NNW3_JUNHY
MRIYHYKCSLKPSDFRFLQDKAECEQQFQRRMQQLTWGAQEVAMKALIQHVEEVKAENRLLRHELMGLLQHCQLLRDTRVRLQDQKEELLRENLCLQLMPARHRRDSLPSLPVRASLDAGEGLWSMDHKISASQNPSIPKSQHLKIPASQNPRCCRHSIPKSQHPQIPASQNPSILKPSCCRHSIPKSQDHKIPASQNPSIPKSQHPQIPAAADTASPNSSSILPGTQAGIIRLEYFTCCDGKPQNCVWLEIPSLK